MYVMNITYVMYVIYVRYVFRYVGTYCRTPVWLKTAFALLVQKGGVRKGKIGARAG